ncbi:MAG: hypothetical protein J5777_07565 [Clostridiales bacterium]|nr:hypothetical protein [Clostridiales bacterium]
MKKMRSAVSMALVLAMALGIAGCAQKLVLTPPTSATTTEKVTETTDGSDESTKETEKETEKETTASESNGSSESSESAKASGETTSGTSASSSAKTSETTAANSGLATVSIYNAYSRSFKSGKKTYTTRVPKIMIAGVNTTKVNKEIADKFKPIAKKNTGRVFYSYYVRKYLISVFITVEQTVGNKETRNYYVYNVSRINGKKLTRAQVLKSLGYKEATFNEKVKAGIQNMWKKDYKTDTAAAKKMKENSLKTSTLNSAMPYMNSEGKVCYLVRQIEVPGQRSHIDLFGTIK